MDTLLLSIKALHVISVISWMAGLLYLPRLFVYHCDAELGSVQSETFKVMERRLLRAIMSPAMMGTFIFGGIMLATPGIVDWGSGWIWVKLVSVALLMVMHIKFGRWQKDFEADANTRTPRTYRLANEVPTVLMIIIVAMVIVRPF
jgi:putative membrane protein